MTVPRKRKTGKPKTAAKPKQPAASGNTVLLMVVARPEIGPTAEQRDWGAEARALLSEVEALDRYECQCLELAMALQNGASKAKRKGPADLFALAQRLWDANTEQGEIAQFVSLPDGLLYRLAPDGGGAELLPDHPWNRARQLVLKARWAAEKAVENFSKSGGSPSKRKARDEIEQAQWRHEFQRVYHACIAALGQEPPAASTKELAERLADNLTNKSQGTRPGESPRDRCVADLAGRLIEHCSQPIGAAVRGAKADQRAARDLAAVLTRVASSHCPGLADALAEVKDTRTLDAWLAPSPTPEFPPSDFLKVSNPARRKRPAKVPR